MKVLKWLLVLLVLFIAAALFVWGKRESILLGQINGYLEPQGFQATALSLASLDTGHVSFRRLELRQDDGTRYRLQGLSLPLRLPGKEPLAVNLDSGELIPPPGDAGPVPAAGLLELLLALPVELPNTSMHATRFEVQGYLEADDIEWREQDGGQTFGLSIKGARLQARMDAAGPAGHTALLDVTVPGVPAVEIPLQITRESEGFSIMLQPQFDLQSWVPWLSGRTVLPAGLHQARGIVSIEAGIRMADDPQQPIGIKASLQASEPLHFELEPPGAERVRVDVSLAEPARLAVTWPSLAWTAEAPRFEVAASRDGLGTARLLITQMRCRAGDSCFLAMAAEADRIVLDGLSVTHASLATAVELLLGEPFSLSLHGETGLVLEGLQQGDFKADRIELTGLAGATVKAGANGWQAEANAAQLTLAGMSAPGPLEASLALELKQLQYSEQGIDVLFEASAGALKANWQGNPLPAPRLSGGLQLQGSRVASSIVVGEAGKALQAKLAMGHDLDTGNGRARLDSAVLLFARRPLKEWAPGLPGDWDVVDGNASFAGAVDWSGRGLSGQFNGELTDIAGFYADIAFRGLDSVFSGKILPGGGFSIDPLALQLDLLDIGFPIENMEVKLQPDFDNRTVQVDGLTMSLLGGRMSSEEFSYAWEQDLNIVPLQLQNVQLKFMVGLANLEGLDISGALSGALPVRIGLSGLTVDGARWVSDSPGGHIRYLGSLPQAGMGNMGIDLVQRALSDFNYSSLKADVDYSQEGDMVVKMRLEGVNPSMDPLQPVILNLSIENNLKQLLRSLQATRAIEDVLE